MRVPGREAPEEIGREYVLKGREDEEIRCFVCLFSFNQEIGTETLENLYDPDLSDLLPQTGTVPADFFADESAKIGQGESYSEMSQVRCYL